MPDHRYITVFDKEQKLVAQFVIDGQLDGEHIISSGYNFEYSECEPRFFVPDDTGEMHVVTNKEAMP